MSRIPGILALGAASFQLACGQWQTIGDIDSVTGSRPGELTVRSGSALVQVRILKQEVVQVRCAPSGSFDPGTSWAVVHPPELAPDAVTRESRDALTLSTRHLSVVVSRRPLRVAVLDSAGEVLVRDDEAKGMAWSGTEVRVWKTMPQGERYYGFGEKAGSLERGCMAMTMWNSDIPAYAADTDPLYQTIPFFYGLRGGRAYGIFFDNTFRSSFDMGKESRSAYSFGAEGGDLNYYVSRDPERDRSFLSSPASSDACHSHRSGRLGTSSAAGAMPRRSGSAKLRRGSETGGYPAMSSISTSIIWTATGSSPGARRTSRIRRG